nr:hypothetical protein GCM10020093_068120 [Planobispora longispora]
MDFRRWTRGVRTFTSGWGGAFRRAVSGRVARATAIMAVAAAGAWLGVALGGPVRATVGPVEAGMSAEVSWTGETVVDARPLGTLLFDTHDAPIRLRVTLENINTERARAMLEDPGSPTGSPPCWRRNWARA